MELGELTYDTFVGRVGQTFRDGETGTALELIAVDDITATMQNLPEGQRAPFSLLFRGSGETLLPQSIRALAHDGLGELAIFLVPVALEADGYRYQAIFT